MGYVRGEDRRLEPDPQTAPAVRKAFEQRAAGDSWRQIADALGLAVGRPMYGATLSRMIANRVYLGEARQGKYVNREAHPALVEPELWKAAQLHKPRPPRGKADLALLSGLLRCAGCSRVMSNTVTPKGRDYRCSRHGAGGTCSEPAIISGRIVEPIIEQAVLERIDQIAIQGRELAQDRRQAEQAVQTAQGALDAFMEASKDLPTEPLREGLRSRVADLEDAQAQLAELSGEPQGIDPTTVKDEWANLTARDRNAVLRGALDCVFVQKGRGNALGRVKLIPHGAGRLFTLPQGRKRFAPVTVEWDGYLPGEVRLAAD